MKKYLIVAFCFIGFLSGCKDEIISDSSSIVFPDSAISYSKHVEPLFSQRCTFSGCHGRGAPAAGLNLTPPSYSNLMNHQPRLVVAGQSANNLLVQRLDGRVPPQMPLNSTPLTANQLNGIKKWIDEGAQNN